MPHPNVRPARALVRRHAVAVALTALGYAVSLQADDYRPYRTPTPTPVTGASLSAATCVVLKTTLSVPNTVFTDSSVITAGTLTLAGQPVPSHCRVTGRMFDRTGPIDGLPYAIGFEIRLPLEWNGRFWYQANGGIDGAVVTATGNTSGGGPLTSALLQGFAVISSDAGHSGGTPFFGVDPQARLDYGYQAVGKLTPMAKSVVTTAYSKAPGRSYIGGCSNGGRHTLVAASRYADLYDGFLVGDPGFNLPKAAVANIYGAQQYARIDPAAIADPTRLPNTWTAAERQLVSNRVLAKCDALDGVTDGLIGNYQACQRHFSLADDVPTCAGARDGTCLSPIQKDAIANIFSGARLSNGRPFYKSFPFDSGHGSANTLFWEFTASLNLDSGAVGFIFGTPPQAVAGFNGPNFTLTSDVDSLYRSIFAVNGTYTQSGMQFMTPPEPYELERFRRLGRKLVAYHGVSDAIFSVNDTVDWYRRFARGDDEDDDRRDRSAGARLFLIPGMNHCSGGPSTDQFDALSALVKWVEQGVAPERLTASARGPGNAGGVNAEVPTSWAASRTRPLCAYPKSPYYIGGDVERAESFACR